MDASFLHKLFHTHKGCPSCPTPTEVSTFFTDLLGTLYADFAKLSFETQAEFENHVLDLQHELARILTLSPQRDLRQANEIATRFFDTLPELYNALNQDVEAMYAGDPAAKSRSEVIRTYPGFYAIAAYRVAHKLHTYGIAEVPRIITEHAHSKTGIDIHPAARIGKHFCIDHGTGIVIGETAIIGDHVKLYQGVTLGALSVSKEDAERKRHPTLEDHIVVYAGATILGGETVIGSHSIIGGNVWLTRSVPSNSKLYYQSKMFNGRTGETDVVVFKN